MKCTFLIHSFAFWILVGCEDGGSPQSTTRAEYSEVQIDSTETEIETAKKDNWEYDSSVVENSIREVHNRYIYRLPREVVERMKLAQADIVEFESLIAEQRSGTLEHLSEWVEVFCRKFHCSSQDVVRIHSLALEYEGRNATIRFLRSRRAIDDEHFNEELFASRETMIGDADAQLSPVIADELARIFLTCQ